MYARFVKWLCSGAVQHPVAWMMVVFVLSAPAAVGIRDIRLDTNLIRLLPEHSPASVWTRKLETVIGDGGYFTLLLEGIQHQALVAAVDDAARRLRLLPRVYSVTYQYPLDYIDRYKYLLISSTYLEALRDKAISLKARYNPFAEDLLSEPAPSSHSQDEKRQESWRRLLTKFDHITRYHQSPDGKLMGIFIRPRTLITDMDNMRLLYHRIEAVAAEIARRHAVRCQVGGSQIKNLREYSAVVSDLGRAGIISGLALLLILVLTFRSLRVVPVMLLPLALGLMWSFALVPAVIGPLNIITAFLLLILVGLGIDYAIHLLKRFQLELLRHGLDRALRETFLSTGRSVVVSALTTALPMVVLSFSDFRGFSDFGMISAGAILGILLAMFVVMPPTLVISHRMGIVGPRRYRGWWLKPIGARATAVLIVLILAGGVLGALKGTGFDYRFIAYATHNETIREFQKKHRAVYPHSMNPAALYMAPTLSGLDRMLEVLQKKASRPDALIDRVASIRDFVPSAPHYRRRLHLVREIKAVLRGGWTRRIKDPQLAGLIERFRNWPIPTNAPRLQDVPADVRSFYTTLDGSGRFVVGIYSKGSRRDGRSDIAFTRELYALHLPTGVEGPVGEIPVFAEILIVVFREAPWVISLALLSVALPILLTSRSFRDTAWMLLPLFSGMGLTFGVMALLGMRMNHFSIIVIPALLGMGVDDGVHYYMRVQELGGDVDRAQQELWSPLTVCTLTTITGYFGLVLSGHAGLRSIGMLATIGMSCLWLTSLVLFPGILKWKNSVRAGAKNTGIAIGPQNAP